MQKLIIVLLIGCAWLLHGCASVSAPTGGKKDVVPPQTVRTNPKNQSLNFRGQTIEMVFDEFIQVDNLKQELLITPDIDGTYESKPIKNGLRLVFDKPFRPNTTYTLNFRNAIKDVTEKNIADKVKLVFSTGDKIDTLSVRGIVTDLLSGKPAENAIVSLYRTDDTLDILKHKPFYFTKTDKKGVFLLENLKQDNYRIYALEDRNNNLKYDANNLQNEKIAFLLNPVALDTNYTMVKMTLSKMDAVPPRITSRSGNTELVSVEFDEGLRLGTVSYANKTENPVFNLVEEGKKLVVYNTLNQTDSIPVQVIAIDSAGNQLKQAVNIKFDEPAASRSRANATPRAKEKMTTKTSPSDGEKILRDLQYTFHFSKPIVQATLADIVLLADTISKISIDPSADLKWNAYKTSLTLTKKLDVKQRVRVSAPKGTFFSIDGDTASVINTTHELKEAENYGSIAGQLQTKAPNFIVQLLEASSLKILAEIRNQTAYKFIYLNAGDYLIRVIIDENNNGIWDQGNLLERRLPERVMFGSNTIKLKENWELTDQDISI
jgi:hypothetical protein